MAPKPREVDTPNTVAKTTIKSIVVPKAPLIRSPNNGSRTALTTDLGLEQVGIEKDDRGLIKIDKQCRTNIDNIYAIGDIVAGPPLAHKASYEGKIAAEAISGEKAEIDYLSLPAVVFSDPELATVGYTEQEAKDAGYDVKAAKFERSTCSLP